ncbi:MAG: TetR/AcrR family transcriptional regulator [Mobilitalea sp.]
MEKFQNLAIEKQNTIINAALESFGTNGYKKTSVSDIAAAAGISKAMVFHYFGTKRDLYFYLLNYCFDIVMGEINDTFDKTITDFFDRITNATNIKLAILMKHPAALSYLNSVYFESNEEVRDDIKIMMSQTDAFRNKIAFDGMDLFKFKESVDVKVVMKMLMWIGEGFVNPAKKIQISDLEKMCDEFYEAMNLLRDNLYKEEYL